jgi:hypothetical protein
MITDEKITSDLRFDFKEALLEAKQTSDRLNIINDKIAGRPAKQKANEFYFTISKDDGVNSVVLVPVSFYDKNKHLYDSLEMGNVEMWPDYLFEYMESFYEWDEEEFTTEQVKSDLISRGFVWKDKL